MPLLVTITIRTSDKSQINILCLPKEPEEDVSFEDLEERAKSGDTKAQTKVGVHLLFANSNTL